MDFAQIVYVIFEWLLVLAMLGLLGVIGWLIMTALQIKTSVMKNAKRLYAPPTRSVQSLIATGKGIAQQETVRVRHITGSAKIAVVAVKEATGEVKTSVNGVHIAELKSSLANVQSVFKFVTIIRKLSKSAVAKQTVV